MTPARCDQFIARTAYLLSLLNRRDIPQDVILEIEVLLNLNEKATRYTPHITRVEVELEPE